MKINPAKACATQAQRGFSLLELAAVVAVLSIIAGLSIPAIGKWISLSKIDAVKTILNSVAAEWGLGKVIHPKRYQ